MAESLVKPEYRDQYCRAMKVCYSKCDGYEVEAGWMKSRLGDILLEKFSVDQTIRILSVGCGTGIKDLGLLEALRNRRVEYTAFDSSQEMVQQFQQNVVNNERFAHVDFKLLTTSCEQFIERDVLSTYEVIHFVHVVYCINHIDQVISKYMRLLSPEGMLVILCLARDAPGEKVKTRVMGVEPMSPDLGPIIQRLGYDYRKETVSHHVDIASLCGLENSETPDGSQTATTVREEAELLLEWQAYVGNFRENYPPACVAEFVTSLCAASVRDGNKLLLEMPVEAFFINAKSV